MGLLKVSWGHLGVYWGLLGGLLGASWGALGSSWGPLGGLLGASRGSPWGSQSGLGRMLERLEVKVPFECDLEATWSRLGAVLGDLEPSWVHLGAVLGPAWGHLGASCGRLGASLGALGAILGPLLAFEDACAGMLENAQKPNTYCVFGPSGGPRERQVGAKLGQVGPKLGQVGHKLGSSWHLEAMLQSSCHHLAVLTRLGAVLEATWPNLSRQRGRLGRQEAAACARVTPA